MSSTDDLPRRPQPPAREYGPFDDLAARARMMRVTVGSRPGGKWARSHGAFREYDTNLPESIVKQLRAVNGIAYDAGQAARRRREAGQ